MGRAVGLNVGLPRRPRITPSPMPTPSRWPNLDGGKDVELSEASLSPSLEDLRQEKIDHVIVKSYWLGRKICTHTSDSEPLLL